jgi:hypothetical protein
MKKKSTGHLKKTWLALLFLKAKQVGYASSTKEISSNFEKIGLEVFYF